MLQLVPRDVEATECENKSDCWKVSVLIILLYILFALFSIPIYIRIILCIYNINIIDNR